MLLSPTSSSPDRSARRQRSHDSSRPGTDNVKIRLLQLDTSRQTTITPLQRIQNAAARLIFRVGHTRVCHSEPTSVAFYCRSVGGSSSSCAVSCCQPSMESVRAIWTTYESCRLRSSSSRSLVSSSTDFSLPRLCTNFGECAFTYAGTSAWNSLPEDLRAVSDPGLYYSAMDNLKDIR